MSNKSIENFAGAVEGIEIMNKPQPSITRLFFLLIVLLIPSIIILATLGKIDVIISAKGSIASAKAVQKIFTPVSGEIVDIFVSEGATVREGDVLIRLRSRGAIQMAAEAEKKNLELDQARFALEVLWPEKQKLKLKDIETNRAEARTLTENLSAAKKNYNNFPKSTRLSHKQHKMAFAEAEKEYENQNLTVKETEISLEKTRSDYERYRQLYKIGAISKEDLEEKKNTFEEKKYSLEREKNSLKTQKNNISKIQLKMSSFLMSVGSKLQNTEATVQKIQDELNRKNLTILMAKRQIQDEERSLKQKLVNVKIDYDTLSKVKFENIDSDQCLRLIAPCTGEVTSIAVSQKGEIVKQHIPLIAVGPLETEKKLQLKIKNRDRGFIKPGQTVKIKLDAFPFQRYGMINGILETISPDVIPDKELGPCYLANVKLLSSSILAEGERHKLNYGMTATAEIVVRRQRLINYILDPFKRI